MELLNKNNSLKGVRIIGWAYSILGAISIIFGIVIGTIILGFFPIFRYILISPLRNLLERFSFGFMPGEIVNGGLGSINSILNIPGAIISFIGGIVLLSIGISLLKNRRVYLFMTLFSFSALLGVFRMLDFLNYFDLASFLVESAIMVLNLWVGYYFLKLYRGEFKK